MIERVNRSAGIRSPGEVLGDCLGNEFFAAPDGFVQRPA
jgi:hypothetical protein